MKSNTLCTKYFQNLDAFKVISTLFLWFINIQSLCLQTPVDNKVFRKCIISKKVRLYVGLDIFADLKGKNGTKDCYVK